MREELSSRLGFILLSAGCAIGMGNVWRFPYVTGQSGGGFFVLIYLAFLALLGIPVLTMEFASGRASGCSLAMQHAALTPGRRFWRIHGVVGLVGCVMLMMFYTTVVGWTVLYGFRTAGGWLSGCDSATLSREFTGMLDDPWCQLGAMVAVCAGSAAVCAVGLQRGLERVTKWMMLALLALIVVLAAHSVLLDRSGAGLRFYLLPDWARLRATGVGNVLSNAMNQAFFSLSIGIGGMSIFGSYVSRRRALLGEAVNVVALDTFVAICAGLIILPASFAYGIEPGQGPGLVFVTLPHVFNRMPLGRLWGSVFFLFMIFAGLTTVLTVFEAIVASLRDYFGWSRRVTCATVGALIALLSVPCILGFNVWSSFQPLGEGTNVLDLEDCILSDFLLPAGGLLFALSCCHRFGWGWEKFRAEANCGEGLKVPSFLRFHCAYVVPTMIVVIFVLGVIRRFR